jgi:hypothetical protein
MPTRFSPSLSVSGRSRRDFEDAGRVEQSPSGLQTSKSESSFILHSHGTGCCISDTCNDRLQEHCDVNLGKPKDGVEKGTKTSIERAKECWQKDAG